ncbi:MAG: ATP-binding cassette domain-containing protein [Eggerthellaceae bacterium]|nr:ATP-binding cassette domain-containing protein [Eggerthellaceae bacterium]
MIEISKLSKVYTTKKATFHALHDVSLSVEKGAIFGIIGQSGAGKSTLIRCINLLERPTSGSVVIDGNDITHISGKQLAQLREDIGMIFQDFSLFAQRNALSNVMFPLEIKGIDKTTARNRAHELLDLVGLGDKAHNFPSELSGGQKQRVAIARALANNPKIILCDEPTSALDTITTHAILQLLKNINESLGVTLVLITHELSVIEQICDYVAVIDAGKIIEQGRVDDVFKNPQANATKILLEASHRISSHETQHLHQTDKQEA